MPSTSHADVENRYQYTSNLDQLREFPGILKMMTNSVPDQTARPDSVTNAVKLLYATFGIGVLRSVIEFQNLAQPAPISLIFTAWVIAAIIMLLLIYCIGRRRNWARIAFLVLFAVGMPFAIQHLLQSISEDPISGILSAAQMAGQITALVLLFQNTSNAWFRRPGKPQKRNTESVEF